jgi:hypothetical protein
MKNISTLLFLILQFFLSYGQTGNSPETYIYLVNDSLIKTDNLEVKLTPIGKPYFQAGNLKIKLDDVKFYKDFTGFYGKVNYYTNDSFLFFALQTSHGKINTYRFGEVVSTRPVLNTNYGTNNDFIYYNKGMGELKRINYTNFKVDLADNPLAIEHLKKYRRCKITATGFALAGLFSIVDGIVISAIQTKKDREAHEEAFMAGRESVNDRPGIRFKPLLIGIGGGVGCFVIAGRFSINKRKQLRQAIDIYNQ